MQQFVEIVANVKTGKNNNARLADIRQAVLRRLATLADIRQAVLHGLARLTHILERFCEDSPDSPTLAKGHFREKCDSPRQILE